MELEQAEALESLNFLDPNIIKQNFPFTPRGNQSWVLDQVAEAICRPDINFVVIQAPTGAGKSPIAMALARSVEQAYVMTVNKNLQDQYFRDFGNYIADLRGRGNYSCYQHKGYSCGDSPCRQTAKDRRGCRDKAACEYHEKVDAALSSKICSMNFAAGLSFLNHNKKFGVRQLQIIDEAHLLEDNLTGFIEFSVTAEQLLDFGLMEPTEQIPMFDQPRQYLPWIETLCGRATEIADNGSFTGDYDKFETMLRKVHQIRSEVSAAAENMILDHEMSKVTGVVTKITFRPLDVSRYAKKYLFSHGIKTVFLSATIINYRAFIRALGINESEAVFIDVPSTFPKENRPIHRPYVGNLSYSNIETLTPLLARVSAAILEQRHPNQKGIIHVPSYALAKGLMAHFPQSIRERILFPQNAGQQNGVLTMHKETSEPTVLLSPSMAEGVDLKDDLSRFQIIAKVPYPSLGDKIVKARRDRDPEWYPTKTMLKLIQMYGRSVRTETDTAETYILDGTFDFVYRQIRHTLPSWFREVVET